MPDEPAPPPPAGAPPPGGDQFSPPRKMIVKNQTLRPNSRHMSGNRTHHQSPAPSNPGATEIQNNLNQAYQDERKILIEGEQTSSDQFDKQILALASGALGISIVFLEKIAPHPGPATFKYLYFAWGGLVFSLLSTLSSFLTSQHAYRRQIQILEAKLFPQNSEGSDDANHWARATRYLNWTSILGFIFGIGMLVLFSISNTGISDQQKPATKPAANGIP